MAKGIHRLKKVQGKKKRDAAEAEAKRQLENASNGEIQVIQDVPNDLEESVDLLRSKDKDVIF